MTPERLAREEAGIEALVNCSRARGPSISTGADTDGEEDRKVSITFPKILKWLAVLGTMFGAGYVLRGVADSTSGTASLVTALKGQREPEREGDGYALSPGAAGAAMGPPPSPEELEYWNQWFRKGAAATLPRVPALPPAPPHDSREPYEFD